MIYLLVPLVLFCLLFSFATFKGKENAGKFAFRGLIHSVSILAVVSIVLIVLYGIYDQQQTKKRNEIYKQNYNNVKPVCGEGTKDPICILQ